MIFRLRLISRLSLKPSRLTAFLSCIQPNRSLFLFTSNDYLGWLLVVMESRLFRTERSNSLKSFCSRQIECNKSHSRRAATKQPTLNHSLCTIIKCGKANRNKTLLNPRVLFLSRSFYFSSLYNRARIFLTKISQMKIKVFFQSNNLMAKICVEKRVSSRFFLSFLLDAV